MRNLSCSSIIASVLSVWLLTSAAVGQETLSLCDFEASSLPNLFEYVSGQPELVTDGALEGKQSLQITFDPKAAYHGAYLSSFRLPRDWSGYDALILDIENPSPRPIPGTLLVADQAWEENGRSYWNRHNGQRALPPGRSEWVIPVRGLFRGEAGSRNNDIKRNVDPASIVRVDVGFGGKGSEGRILIDHLRLVKLGRPDGVWAFDFGPPAQSTMLGWTPVSNETAYSTETGFGWGPGGGSPWSGAARDTTFGTHLLQDFCEAGGYNYHIDAPPGRYQVVVFFENSGYWGGEQAAHGHRKILVDGDVVWEEARSDGPMHALVCFEDVEPIGLDVWDTYMKNELARPARFEVIAGEGGLTLRFEADRTWGSKIAALATHHVDDTSAAKWLAGQVEKVADEFRDKAICLDQPPPEFVAPAAFQPGGIVAWPVRIEEDITPHSLPSSLPPKPDSLRLARLAVRAEMEMFCLAIRPLRDFPGCRLELEPFQGPDRLRADIRVVRYNTSRDFGNVAYRVSPHTVRRTSDLDLPKDITRQIIVSTLVHQNTQPGEYNGALRIKDNTEQTLIRIPLQLTVRPVTLDRQSEFLMGYFGLMPPNLIPEERRWEVLDQTLRMIRLYGMNAVSGGPSWRITGWKNSQPLIDFQDMDRFVALLEKRGFTGALNGYGGARFSGLHARYEKGEVAQQVARESGLSYEEAMMRAWQAVDAHARDAGWPVIYYAMCDETRVRDQAERELEFMRLMGKVSAAYPHTVRTSGSYSVRFNQRPEDQNDLLYWHQRYFEALDISSLNLHDPSVLDEAQRLDKEVHIYNQGRSRYSFGLYQWSEYQKGVKARWQWHLNILHGYQFFDLDGREPDTAMICYGRDTLYPTIHFERCREGAEDFYLYQMLSNQLRQQVARGDDRPAVDAAHKLLQEAVSGVQLNQRQPPAGFDADALKKQVVEAIVQLQNPSNNHQLLETNERGIRNMNTQQRRQNLLSRRAFVAGAAACAGGFVATNSSIAEENETHANVPPEDYRIKNGRIKQSVYGWCFKPMPTETLIDACFQMGVPAMDIGPNFYPKLSKLGMHMTMAGAHGFRKGPFSRDNHPFCIEKLREGIDTAVECHCGQVITFTGMREEGTSDEQGAANCVECWKQVIDYAEEKRVNLCLEILNTRDDSHPMKGHPGYFGDDVDLCIDLIKRVDSPRMKLLFDVYHVQVMNGDVIRRLRQYQEYIGHYHVAGVPGRGELDENQEVNYPAVMRAILETGYDGYVSQEFIPTWSDKLAALRHALNVCDI